jgi:hypothetical protein
MLDIVSFFNSDNNLQFSGLSPKECKFCGKLGITCLNNNNKTKNGYFQDQVSTRCKEIVRGSTKLKTIDQK